LDFFSCFGKCFFFSKLNETLVIFKAMKVWGEHCRCKSPWQKYVKVSFAKLAMIFHHHFVPMLRLSHSCLCPPCILRHGLFRGDFDIYREDLRDDSKDRDIETAPKTPHIRGSFSHSATSSRLRIDLSLKPGADYQKPCRKIWWVKTT
jgi:hypothetical protein